MKKKIIFKQSEPPSMTQILNDRFKLEKAREEAKKSKMKLVKRYGPYDLYISDKGIRECFPRY